jgi:hypothetical protein
MKGTTTMRKRKHKHDSKYSLSDLENLHRQGQISNRELVRAGGSVAGLGELDNPEFQRDAGPGFFGKTQQWGAPDLGHIDSRANRRPDKESRMRGKAEDNSRLWPSDAHVRRVSAHQFHPGWYSSGPGRER